MKGRSRSIPITAKNTHKTATILKREGNIKIITHSSLRLCKKHFCSYFHDSRLKSCGRNRDTDTHTHTHKQTNAECSSQN